MIRRKPEGLILILEDSDEDFDTALEALAKTGISYGVRRAKTGDECLMLIKESGGEVLHPALILLDLNTPGLDGRDALREIKADAKLKELPVVVFSTSGNQRDLELCYRHGANAYHVKPVKYPDYLGRMQQVFTYWLGCVVLPLCQEVPQ
ncbi:MAG: response regulator [Verrucomicrobiota bacterium]